MVLPLPLGMKMMPCRKRRLVVPRSTKPNRLAMVKACHGISLRF